MTENAQCGLWNKWCSDHKKPCNARISHNENPSRSDAVKFFFHTLNTEPYSFFNFKASLYNHFQLILGSILIQPPIASSPSSLAFGLLNTGKQQCLCIVTLLFLNRFVNKSTKHFVHVLNVATPSLLKGFWQGPDRFRLRRKS